MSNSESHSGNENPILKQIICSHEEHLAKNLTFWKNYDLNHCLDHSDHDHDHIIYDGETLTITNLVLYIILGSLTVVLVILTIACFICWKVRQPVNIVPILPTGNDADNWEEVRKIVKIFGFLHVFVSF